MILEAFNGVFFAVFGGTVAFIVLLWALFRKTSEKTRKIVLIGLCVINLIIFCVYKYFLSLDQWYMEQGLFNWWSELPLHLCNINMFLIPIGILTKKRGIMGFSFFLAPLGATMASVFSPAAFTGFSLALPRMWGFYATHMLIIVCGITLATFNLYRPRVKDLPRIAITFFLLAFAAFCITVLLRNLTGCTTVNYFFTWTHDDISILKMFWNLIPVPFLYELPAILILAVYMAIVCGLFKLFGKKQPDTAPTENTETEKETVEV